MNSFEIINKTDYKVNRVIKKIIKRTLRKENIKKCYLSIVLILDEEMIRLNKEYRNKEKTTDVLSFPLINSASNINYRYNVMGEIYINIPLVEKQAKDNGHSPTRELGYLIIHGILHVIGYTHDTKKEEDLMIKKQEEILNEFRNTKI